MKGSAGILMRKHEIKELLSVASGEKRAELVIKGVNVVNVCSSEIYEADIAVHKGIIVGVDRGYEGIREEDEREKFAVPGLIDAHTHLEMSMLSASEFARVVVPRGTTAVVADPHEIANVLGVEGVRAMIEDASRTPLKLFFTAPPCVPSTRTGLETGGASISVADVEEMLRDERCVGIAEVMDVNAVINGEEEIFAKILAAKHAKKAVDGHAPMLSGKLLNAYVLGGACSDHECVSADEALEKIRKGMHVMVREGTAARNLRAIAPLLRSQCTERFMLVTDGDRATGDLWENGCADFLVRRAIEEGIDPVKAVQMCTINPAMFFNLKNIGSITPGKIADIVIVESIEQFEVRKVFVNGVEIKEEDFPEHPFNYPKYGKSVNAIPISAEKLVLAEEKACRLTGERRKARIIQLVENEIITEEKKAEISGVNVEKDILKVAVIERHNRTGNVGIGFVRGFGLKSGAIASSVSHDSHNIVVVGTNEGDMALACNRLTDIGGGIVMCDRGSVICEIPLPIAGLMSDERVERVIERCNRVDEEMRVRGCGMNALYALSFIALPVIPSLRITDKGLVDVRKGEIVPVFC